MELSQGGDSRGRRLTRTKEWECQLCTLLNTYKRKTCAACLTERPEIPDLALSQSQSIPLTQGRKRLRLSATQDNTQIEPIVESQRDEKDESLTNGQSMHVENDSIVSQNTKEENSELEMTSCKKVDLDWKDQKHNKENHIEEESKATDSPLRHQSEHEHVKTNSSKTRKRKLSLRLEKPREEDRKVLDKLDTGFSANLIYQTSLSEQECTTNTAENATKGAPLSLHSSISVDCIDKGKVIEQLVDTDSLAATPTIEESVKLDALNPHSNTNVPFGSFFYQVLPIQPGKRCKRLRRKQSLGIEQRGESTLTAANLITSKWLGSTTVSPKASQPSFNPTKGRERDSENYNDPTSNVASHDHSDTQDDSEAPSFQLINFAQFQQPQQNLNERQTIYPTQQSSVPDHPDEQNSNFRSNSFDGSDQPSFNILTVPSMIGVKSTSDIPGVDETHLHQSHEESSHEFEHGYDNFHLLVSQSNSVVQSPPSLQNNYSTRPTPISSSPVERRPQDTPLMQSSSKSKSLRDAGLDDSSEDEIDYNESKHLRSRKSSSNCVEEAMNWTCKWCTYINDEGSGEECECCGQSKEKQNPPQIRSQRSTRQIPDEEDLASEDEEEAEVDYVHWQCKMCTYENFKNPNRCELCDTPKGATDASQHSQGEVQDTESFDGFEMFSDGEENHVVDLTRMSTPQNFHDENDSIEEISDTEMVPPTASRDTPTEIQEFTTFTPVSALSGRADSIDYMNMFGANRGGKSYADRLEKRIQESHRRKASEARGESILNGKNKKKKGNKKSSKTNKKTTSSRGKSSTYSPFRKASSIKILKKSTPILLDKNFKPKKKTNSMHVITESDSFDRNHTIQSIDTRNTTRWEGQGSIFFTNN